VPKRVLILFAACAVVIPIVVIRASHATSAPGKPAAKHAAATPAAKQAPKPTARRAAGTSDRHVHATVKLPRRRPARTAFPTIVGTPMSGRVLRATVGKWANAPRHFSFQWYDENTPIPGATHSTYRVTNNDVDHTLDVSVTAANARGTSRPAPSLATGTVVLPCGRVVSSTSALISAVENGNSPGKATCVRAGTYSVHSLNGHQSTMTTIEAYPGDPRPVLSGSIGLGGSNLRIEGFTTTGGFYTNDATDVKVVGNLFENCTACGSLLFVNNDHDGGNITVAHNLMYNVKQTGAFNDGYGVYGCSGGWSGLYILFNTFDTMNQHPVQLGGCKGVQIVGNEMRNVTYDMAPATGGDNYGEHVDCIEMWNQSTQMLIANNRCENTAPPGGQGMLLSGDTTYGTLRNNLIVDISDQCVDDTPNETSSSSFNNWTVENNTVEACGYSFNGGGLGGSYGFDMDGPNSTGNVFKYNIFTSWETNGSRGQFSSEDSNAVEHGQLPHAPGTHDRRVRPRFADHHNWRALNLPGNWGYHATRVGYLGNTP
jgi:hypothetical protein